MRFYRLISLMMLCIVGIGSYAYEVGQDLTALQTSWTNSGNDYGECKERYSETAYTAGKILYMSISGLESVGYYEVEFYAVANMAWKDFATGTSIAEWYVNDVSDYMNVIAQTGCTPRSETYLRKATVYVSDGKLEFGIKNVATGGNWYVAGVKSIVYKGQPRKSNPIDITSTYIKNAGFETSDTKGWSTVSSDDTGARRTDNATYAMTGSQGDYLFNTWWKGTPCTQTVSSLPAGKYQFSSMVSSDGATIYLINGSNTDEYAYTETTDKSKAIQLTKDFVLPTATADYKLGVVGGANGEAGVHKLYVEDGYWWYKADNFKLYYYGNGIENYAEAKSVGEEFAVEADKWYELSVATAADYVFTVGDGSKIIYSQDGAQDNASATGTTVASGDVISLAKGTVYVKASTATTLKMAANSFNYNIGKLTTNIHDGGYVQNGIVTFTYPNAETNDLSAVLELAADASATVNGETKNLTAIENGFQLDLGKVEPSQTFTISISAGVYGYKDNSTNDAITMTLHTPAIFNGRYYLYNTYNKKYFSRGGNYGTQAIVDEYGIAVILTTDANNATDIKMFDSWMNIGFDDFVYTDVSVESANMRRFNVTAVEGGYKLLNTSNSKYLATNADNVVVNAVEGSNLEGTSNIWTFEDVNDHLAVVKALDDLQAKTAASAAGLTANTKAELETVLATALVNGEYVTRDITITGTGNTVKENYQGGSTNEPSSKPLDIFKQETVTDLKPGLYKLSVNAFQRATWIGDVCATGGARGKVYVYANDAKTQLKSITEEYSDEAYTEGQDPDSNVDGKHYPHSTGAAGQAFNKGMYVNVIYVYVTDNQLSFGIQNPTRLGNDDNRGAWTCFDNFTLTYYAKVSLDASYEDLNDALLKYKPWTATGEYVTKYNDIKTACESRTYETITAITEAISTLETDYPAYAWANASYEHPYLVEDVIDGAENTNNDSWNGVGRSTKTGQHWSGNTTRVYFSQNHENGAARKQTVTIPHKGCYLLKTSVRPIYSGSYAEISVGDVKVKTMGASGTVGGTIAVDGTEYESVAAGVAAGATFANDNAGFGWTYNKIMFMTTSDNESKEIAINLSNENNNREADCGGMFLYYIGQNYDVVEGNTHYYYGAYAEAPTFVLTDEVPIVDATKAQVTGAQVERTNPNGLVYLAAGSTADGQNNVVIDNSCDKLVLTDGHPFVATKAFEASNAHYTMSAIATASNGNKFGTLMLPYAVGSLPGKAYSLDQEVTFGGDIRATEVNAIAANKPVLVTAAGAYNADNVSIAPTNETYVNGELVGTYKVMNAINNTFVLQNHEGYVAFFIVNDISPKVHPFRAYIKAQSSAAKQYINIVFDDATTGINDISADEMKTGVIYDISGRKVSEVKKGLYLINGKKTIVVK